METLLAITTAFTVIAVIFVYAMFRQLKRRRVLRATGSLAGGVATASVGGMGVVLLSSVYSYGQLTAEQRLGHIEFKRLPAGEYSARLMLDGELDRMFVLKGDEWQIDARVVTWKPPATILGLDPIYRLERLSGRYSDIDREVNEPRTVHALGNDSPLDIFDVARRFPMLTPGVDAQYGTAAYVPMADGARFEVSLSRDALIARPANEIAADAVGNWPQNSN